MPKLSELRDEAHVGAPTPAPPRAVPISHPPGRRPKCADIWQLLPTKRATQGPPHALGANRRRARPFCRCSAADELVKSEPSYKHRFFSQCYNLGIIADKEFYGTCFPQSRVDVLDEFLLLRDKADDWASTYSNVVKDFKFRLCKWEPQHGAEFLPTGTSLAV